MSSIWSYLRFRDIYDLMGRKCHPIVAWSVLRSCQEVSWLWLLNFELFMPSKLWYADTLVFLYLEVSLQKGVLLQWSMIQFSFCVLHPFWQLRKGSTECHHWQIPCCTRIWFGSSCPRFRSCVSAAVPHTLLRAESEPTRIQQKRLISIETLVSDNDMTLQFSSIRIHPS